MKADEQTGVNADAGIHAAPLAFQSPCRFPP